VGNLAEGQGAYAVGVPSIDVLHVELEERLAALVRAGDDPHPELAALMEHLRRHFDHEEALMKESAFPMADCHAREHLSVIEVVEEVTRRLDAGDVAPFGRLAPAMLEWFAVHASSMDAALAAYLGRASQQTA
jgi:hemerythrin-like metal-binding protein